MALASYDDLVKSVITWSHRKDIQELIPDFITLAEYEMFNNAETQLRIRETEFVSTAAADARYLALPPNFEKARSVQLETSNGFCDVKFKAPEQLQRQITTGQPRFFTVVGTELEFDRVPDSAYTIQIQYYKKPDPITASNQTNIVITDYSNIYLYGALHQLFLWSEDLDEAVKYAGKFQDAIKGANKADKKARFGPAPSMSIDGAIV
jgi:hypothetical protein